MPLLCIHCCSVFSIVPAVAAVIGISRLQGSTFTHLFNSPPSLFVSSARLVVNSGAGTVTLTSAVPSASTAANIGSITDVLPSPVNDIV
eukprot:4311-Heterococcus_DN1.PRE.4